ncbi:MAG: DegT/DnrJ/EryC1/StrS family aminotransferase [Actinomycetes bacterium]
MIPVIKPYFGEEEAEAAAAVVRSGWVAQGPKVAEFERAFAGYLGVGDGVAVSSCTTGLHLMLGVLGIGPGDEVVVPSLSFIATANAVRYCAATPVFADVDPATGNLTWETVEPVLTERTRAVLVVHQAGVPADVEPIRRGAEARGIAVVEDAACAAGSTYQGRPVGVGAPAAAWSFHPRKILTTGEGGMVTTDRADWAGRLRRLREHGMDVSAADRHRATQPVIERYLEVGFNYRMTDIQAAVGLVQLAKLDLMVQRRRSLAERYQRMLAEVPGIRTVADPPHGTTNFQSFWVDLDDFFPVGRDELLGLLYANGVSGRRGIMATHLEPAYAAHPRAPLPVTERITAQTLILPLYHTLTEVEQARVVAVLTAAAKGKGAT